MALTDESGMNTTMLVSPTGGGMPYPVYQNSGNGGFGDGNGWWVILLIIVFAIAGGGWGNNGNNGGAFGGGQPIIVNDGSSGSSVQRGFDQAAIMSGIGAIQSGVQGLSTQLCNCCGDMQMAVANGFSQAEIANNARQIANMQTAFAGQTAMAQGFNAVNSGIADTRYTIASEACADRAAINDAFRDVMAANSANTQRILDKLCDQELQAERRDNANLRSELMYARGQASQVAQSAQIIDGIYNRLNQCPVGTVPVYGEQPIFTCPVNVNGASSGCGCGGSF